MRPYFTTFYITEIDAGVDGRVADHLHPEWANLRIISGVLPVSELLREAPVGNLAGIVTGPTSTTLRFTAGTSRIWGIGLLPLGWAKFVGASAHSFADRLCDPASEPSLSPLCPLVDTLFGPVPDEAAELARITRHFEDLAARTVPEEARIRATHQALVDPEVATVAAMAEHAGLPTHTLERVCRRHFGFPPSLLLRRQRFMRSLSQYMLDPSLTWIGAIDSHYHDQAQFVREFHRFMGMSPSAYAALPHPVLTGVMRARMAAAGAPVQALHDPSND
ncbi:helix-turn-helix domain-containing protein [Novosphingobium sp.]|uniref:helix-turn-helix domain-containing protein n=1 Tax=Novosphingobium sp. TaxID=1874826 RepID=UPI002626E5D7|nr:helix-turn-helix domain-containing protein [Novosphingobium sp.]